MLTWSGKILDLIKHLEHYGLRQVKRNNLLYTDGRTVRRGIPQGRYRVWANETRGVFIHLAGALIVYPGV